MSSLCQEVRLALRFLSKHPAFGAVVVMTVALGVGAVSAVFGVVEGVLLRPLPYEEPEMLARVWGTSPRNSRSNISEMDFLDFRTRNRVFEDMGAFNWTGGGVTLTEDNRGGHYLRAIARLREGMSLEQAQANMNEITRELEHHYPDSNTGLGVKIEKLRDTVIGDVRSALVTLFGAVGFLLLVACANVALVFLARSATRVKEMAIRASLGARRSYLMRQLVIESMVLSVLGGILGYLFALWSTDALVSLAGMSLPRSEDVEVDSTVFGFALAVSGLTGLAFGLIPALHVSRADLYEPLKEGGRTDLGGSRGAGFVRRLLVVAEVALSLVLVIGAGLFIRSFVALQGVDSGLEVQSVVTMSLNLPSTGYGEDADRSRLFQSLLERVRSLGFGLSCSLPLP